MRGCRKSDLVPKGSRYATLFTCLRSFLVKRTVLPQCVIVNAFGQKINLLENATPKTFLRISFSANKKESYFRAQPR